MQDCSAGKKSFYRFALYNSDLVLVVTNSFFNISHTYMHTYSSIYITVVFRKEVAEGEIM